MKTKIATPGGKKPDEVPILTWIISDTNVDLQENPKDMMAMAEAGLPIYYCDLCKLELNSEDTMKAHVAGLKHMKKTLAAAQQQTIGRKAFQNLDEKKKARIDATISQVNLVSKSSLVPQPTKVVMKKKAKNNSACQAVCDLLGGLLFIVALVLFGVSVARIYDFYTANSQIERHNNLVRYVDCLKKNQDVLYNGINDVITKVSNLTEKHNRTKDELSVVEYAIIDLLKELQTLNDSVKHLEEEIHHSDEEEEQVVEYHGTPNPTTTPRVFDGEDHYDEDPDYPFSDSSMSYPEKSSPTPTVTPAASKV